MTALKYWNIHKGDLQWICCNPIQFFEIFVNTYRGIGNSVESLQRLKVSLIKLELLFKKIAI